MENEELQVTPQAKPPFKARFARVMKKIGLHLLDFVKVNYLMFAYIVASLLIELTGIAVTAGKFYMTEPWIFFTFIALMFVISQYIPGHKGRYGLFLAGLIVNFILDLVFIVIFDSTGGTVFDFAMINLRNDAMAIVETLPFSFTFIFVSCVTIALYGTLGYMLAGRMPKPNVTSSSVKTTASLTAVVTMVNVLIAYAGNVKSDPNDLSYMLHQTETATYSNKGILGNLYNELVRGLWFSEIPVGDKRELEFFVYDKITEKTPFTGRAGGYNVVTILCESFEWFTFLYDETRYPNGFAKPVIELREELQEKWKEEHPDYDKLGLEVPDFSEELEASANMIRANLKELFPNLYRFYESESTVVFDNSHSLEKTDISENKSIIGNYPLYEYINYSYPENSIPYSLPNILKELDGVKSNSFHDGYKLFYNRNVHHVNALGFESYTATNDMDIEGDDTGLGERNLDSVMFDVCKEKMFPTGRRFNTYITTITQHGQYAERENLKPYYDKLDRLGILPFAEDEAYANALRYYCAAGMDLDKAIGIMLDYLESTPYTDENGNPRFDENGKPLMLADFTLITMFGDHNCYYQGVSNYVKNIYNSNTKNYTELYRVPVMMKIGNQHIDADARKIEKFTCVADISPTILDLLGITVFSNLTYGVSAFDTSQTSILYSRAYGKFMTDKIYFNSLNNVAYISPDVDPDEYLPTVEATANTLLNKISHVNRIFASDYFAGEATDEFFRRLRRENENEITG